MCCSTHISGCGLVPFVVECSRALRCVMCCWLCTRAKSAPKHHNSRFTGPFTSRIHNLQEAVVTDEDERLGWDIIDDPREGFLEGKAWVRRWVSDGVCRGVHHRAGEAMLTWQVWTPRCTLHKSSPCCLS